MRLLSGLIGALPCRLSGFGAGEDAVNRPYEGGETPPLTYENAPPTDLATQFNQMYPSSGETVYSGYVLQPTAIENQPVLSAELIPDQRKIYATYGTTTPAPDSASGAPQVAVQPSTSAQIFNLINTVAKGLLAVQQTQAQTKLSTAQIAANAEASKVQAQNYVMQQLQQGKQVMVPQSWLQKYATSDTLTKWLTPILIVGGVGLLGYAVYLYAKKRKTVAANPRRRR